MKPGEWIDDRPDANLDEFAAMLDALLASRVKFGSNRPSHVGKKYVTS
jgi:hypothetical protein